MLVDVTVLVDEPDPAAAGPVVLAVPGVPGACCPVWPGAAVGGVSAVGGRTAISGGTSLS
ncbi:hypothetical protein [Candidatus Frankia nodulisporulans]|uniref:hypothetical protein n=1 Tax=Candidatus Frankia nodulisporulans TaxID=2060052 RepID=UPI003703F9FA